jgi:hypothetical protein
VEYTDTIWFSRHNMLKVRVRVRMCGCGRMRVSNTVGVV